MAGEEKIVKFGYTRPDRPTTVEVTSIRLSDRETLSVRDVPRAQYFDINKRKEGVKR